MNRLLKLSALLLSISVLFLISCKKEHSCENCGINKPPIANAGPNQVITLPTDSVSLDASSSSDPDGSISGYLWTKISGPASFTIIKPTDSITEVKAIIAGTYQFELKVTDNGGLSTKDTVQVIVNDITQPGNRPPVANAGTDQTITLPTNNINLDGSGSTDPDNNITNYLWIKISGPSSFNITNVNGTQTQVTNLVQGVYQFELKVTDAGGLFSKDTLRVIVNNGVNTNCDISSRPPINAQLIPFGTLSYARRGMSVASAGNKILFAGGWSPNGGNFGYNGFSRVDIYDIVTHNWSTAELSKPRYDMGVAVSGNKIFFAGGDNSDGGFVFSEEYSNVDIYDASTDSWSVDSLSVPRFWLAGGAVGGKVFFAGGLNNFAYAGAIINVVDIYDLTTNSWSTATLSEGRFNMSAVTNNSKIYFAGGVNNNSNFPSVTNRINIYDNTTSSWSTSALIEPKAGMASIAFAGKIYWAGGWVNSNTGTGTSSQVEIKDINTQTSAVACLFQPNTAFTAVMKDNKIVFFTGEGAIKNKFDIYDTSTNTWSIGVLPVDIYDASIISVNNTIYVAGGYVNGVLSNQVWKLEF